ncbi:unnamed protein product, partial [Urochloa humidicola]
SLAPAAPFAVDEPHDAGEPCPSTSPPQAIVQPRVCDEPPPFLQFESLPTEHWTSVRAKH